MTNIKAKFDKDEDLQFRIEQYGHHATLVAFNRQTRESVSLGHFFGPSSSPNWTPQPIPLHKLEKFKKELHALLNTFTDKMREEGES